MFNFARTTLNPAGYHGRAAHRPFFEGWYFKLVCANEEQRYAIIPGIFLSDGKKVQESHAFIQVLDGRAGSVEYFQFPPKDFQASSSGFQIRIGPNQFSAAALRLNLAGHDITLQGDIRFHFPAPNPWPVTLFSPGIMGPFAWIPRMECYHGVLSLDHGLQGELKINGIPCDFTGGRGYIEKDWGRSFPAAWVWLQSNHFERPGTSITASVGIIPWMNSYFAGFIVGLWHGERLYRFATYTGARIEQLETFEDRVRWRIHQGARVLEIEAARSDGHLLRAPTTSGMDRRIAETLDATVKVRLMDGGQLIFEGVGRNAGLEAVGDLERLRHMALKE